MPGYGRNGDRCGRPPGVADDQRGNGRGKHDARAEDGARVHRDERRSRLIRVPALGCCAAGIGLGLRDDLLMAGVVSVALVHRASDAIRAARHAGLGGCGPTGAHSPVPGDQAETEKNGRDSMHDTHWLKNARPPRRSQPGDCRRSTSDRSSNLGPPLHGWRRTVNARRGRSQFSV